MREPATVDGVAFPRTCGGIRDRIPRRFEERLAVVVPDGLKQSEHARLFAFGYEAIDICQRRIEIGVDLVPVQRSGRHHLIEAAVRDPVDVRLVGLLGPIVPVDENELFRQRLEEFRMTGEGVVPNHGTRTAFLEHELCRVDHVPGIHRTVALIGHEVLRLPTAQIRRLVRPNVKERRVWHDREFVCDEFASVRFAVGICRSQEIAVRRLGERRIFLVFERLVHVRERLLFGDKRNVEARGVGIEVVQLCGRDTV